MPELKRSQEPFQAGAGYEWLIRHSSLRGVQPIEVCAKSHGSGQPDTYATKIGKAARQKSDHVVYTVRYSIEAKREDKLVAEINFRLVALYHTGAERPEFPFEDLVLFGERRALPDIQPYARENASSLATRIGLDGSLVARSIPASLTSEGSERGGDTGMRSGAVSQG